MNTGQQLAISDRLPRGSVNLSADEKSVIIVDQTELPNRFVEIALSTESEMVEAIYQLRVRGAPAIGIMAAYSLFILAGNIKTADISLFLSQLAKHAAALNASRPTAVNLSFALSKMMNAANKCENVGAALHALKETCYAIHAEDITMCRAIAGHGLTLLKAGDGVITHCNAGPLATSQYGTALGPILLAKEQGIEIKVFADETRPLLQGARLTCCELQRSGVDVTLICDSMAASVMRQGKISACMVGCDRVAANGDTANKIGTYSLAITAKYFGIPFYVLGPTSTIDMNCKTGDEIVIEERPATEIWQKWYSEPMAPAETQCFNPAFDITDHFLISAIVTERGILHPPFKESIAGLNL
jgi:methylthioribose-1-phosphate isomerase